MRALHAGQLVFAATLVAIGIVGLAKRDCVAIWQVPKRIPAREVLVWLSALISLTSGLGFFWQRMAGSAARALLACLLGWLLLLKLPAIFHAPAVMVAWEDCAETLVLVAAAWVLSAGLGADSQRQRPGLAAGERAVHIASTLYGLALIPFGLAHFAYSRDTAQLVPAWLPAHLTWVYVTGGAYIAAGLAVVIGLFGRWAAALSAVQMGMFTLLVWGPLVTANPKDSFRLNESLISLALTAGGWIVAASYPRTPWLRPWLWSPSKGASA